MILNSQDLKEIFNSADNDREYPVRIYSGYNLFTVGKVVKSTDSIIIFVGEADNIDPNNSETEEDDTPLLA